jgi:hypothetical protein
MTSLPRINLTYPSMPIRAINLLPEIEDLGSYAIPQTSLDELHVIGELRRSRLGDSNGADDA